MGYPMVSDAAQPLDLHLPPHLLLLHSLVLSPLHHPAGPLPQDRHAVQQAGHVCPHAGHTESSPYLPYHHPELSLRSRPTSSQSLRLYSSLSYELDQVVEIL